MLQNILNRLFRDYKAQLDKAHALSLRELQLRALSLEDEHAKRISAYIQSASLADLVRERMSGRTKDMLKGTDPEGYIEDEGILAWIEKEGREISGFLAECHRLKDNWALSLIHDWNMRKLILHAALKAPDLAVVNFDRASVNGLELMKDDIERLDGEYIARKNAPKQDDFDKHSAISE